jgi:ABC-type dipeptide/oligopeptide/nickel transport system permease component
MTTLERVPAAAPPSQGQRDRRSGSPLARFLLVRLLQMLLTVAILLPLTFLLFRAVPGDAASAVIGPDVDPAVAERLRAQYGLDRPVLEQFLAYCRSLAQGDLGMSFQYKLPVSDLLAERLLNTAVLVVPALLLAVAIGVTLGAFSAASHRRFDAFVGTTGFVIKSAPIFWVSTLALLLFAFSWKLVPSIGMASPGRGADGFGRFVTLDFLHHLLLPLSILVLYYLVEPMLTMRASMKEVLGQEFIQMGRAQGLRRRSVIYRHGARNATLPVVTLAPTLADNVIGGQVIVETVFSWPGMGRAVVEAVNNFDYPMMQGIFLVTAVTVVVVNAVIDVAYAYLDPRVRLR